MTDNRMMDTTKLPYHINRVIDHFDLGKKVAPIHIDTGITKFCDTNCCYCFGIFQNPSKVYIQRDALINYISDAAEIGVKSIAFIGDGEPTLNPAVYEALKLGSDLGLSMAISTSGISMNSFEKAYMVASSCEWMRVSLSAGDAEGYKKIHRVDRFDKIVENIKRIVEIKKKYNFKCDIGLQAVFVPELMNDDMVKEAKLAVELGVDYFVIKQCSLPIANMSVGDVKFDVNSYTSEDVVNKLKEAESYSTEKTKIIPKWKTMERKGARLYKHCPAVPLISEISGNGDWFPCGYFFGNKAEYEKYKFGNLHEKRLKDIFNSDRYWEIIKHMREKFDSDHECFGSCRLDSCNKFIDDYIKNPEDVKLKSAEITESNPNVKGRNFI